MEFPRGFTSWYETFYEVTAFIEQRLQYYMDNLDGINEIIYLREDEQGTGGIYELAKEWTDEFEKVHKDTSWGDEDVFSDTIEEWLTEKNG